MNIPAYNVNNINKRFYVLKINTTVGAFTKANGRQQIIFIVRCFMYYVVFLIKVFDIFEKKISKSE